MKKTSLLILLVLIETACATTTANYLPEDLRGTEEINANNHNIIQEIGDK